RRPRRTRTRRRRRHGRAARSLRRRTPRRRPRALGGGGEGRARAAGGVLRRRARVRARSPRPRSDRAHVRMTYSLVACDLDAGRWGVAVQSKFLAVGSLVAWAEPHVGALATQAHANPRYGPDGLAALRTGL